MMNISTNIIDKVLENAVSDGDFPGVVAGIVQGNGASCTTAFGKQRVAPDQPLQEDAIFRFASMIKPVIAVAAMQLYDKGMFDLDEPASHYLPAIAKLQVLDGFDNGDKPILRSLASEITIRQLFTQISGIAYEIFDVNLLKYVTNYGAENASGARPYRKLPMIDDPGKRWHYGYNTNWLSDLIETLSGEDLKTYFARNIFEPLAMTDTYCTQMPAAQEQRLVTRHTRRPDGSLEEVPQKIWDPSYCGEFGLVSTARDYMSFMQMLLNRGQFHGNQIVRSATMDMMVKNQIGDLNVVKMKSFVPQFIDFELFPESSQENKWGLGWHLNGAAVARGRSRYSLSWAGAYNTYFWVDMKQRVAAVLLLQTEPFAEPKAIELLGRFERAVYATIGS